MAEVPSMHCKKNDLLPLVTNGLLTFIVAAMLCKLDRDFDWLLRAVRIWSLDLTFLHPPEK